ASSSSDDPMTDQISRTPTPPDLVPPTRVNEPAESEQKPKRRAWVWIIVLLILGIVFWWVLTRNRTSSTGARTGRGACGGPVTATSVNVSKGSIGVYLSAIGTVTPVYTDSIVTQVTGQVI